MALGFFEKIIKSNLFIKTAGDGNLYTTNEISILSSTRARIWFTNPINEIFPQQFLKTVKGIGWTVLRTRHEISSVLNQTSLVNVYHEVFHGVHWYRMETRKPHLLMIVIRNFAAKSSFT